MRCPSCGLVQQNPQPLREAVLSRYGESYLAYESARQFAYRDLELLALRDLGFPRLEAEFFDHASGRGKPPSILDVGCATGGPPRAFSVEGLGLSRG